MNNKQSWQDPMPLDKGDALNARRALAMCEFYPTSDLDGDPGLVVMEANLRADLHKIVDRLDRTDLRAVYTLARALALVKRTPDFFTFVNRKGGTQ